MIKQTDTRYRERFYYYENDLYIGKSLELYGEYGQPEIDLLRMLINDQCIVYDVGANIGYYTNAFANIAKHVVAFEPNPKNFELLAKNIEGIPNVYAMNAAIGSKTGYMKCSDFDPYQLGNFGNMKVGTQGDLDVPVIAIDDYPEFPAPDLIKIDVEGMEYDVMKGMSNMITKRKPAIYFEAHETAELPEIYDFLKPLDYQLYWTCVPNYSKNNWKKNDENIFGNTVLMGIIAWQKKLGTIALPELHSRHDTWQELLDSHKNKKDADS